MVEACIGQGNWDVTPACIDAVTDCYPLGTQVLAASDVVGFCSAELEEGCLSGNAPGCGETLCTCTAGGSPYDWNNCWHLLLVACLDGLDGDCETVLDGCYPGVSVAAFSQCQDQVVEDIGYECDCPQCGIHEQCEDALELCLGV
ncbi:hypothetical protein [Nannocystis pusilla]|uniref:hypothetical protein n=1 Tax=Nannocystis pusilla TaxID=889268 RepID=UPI003DA3343A